MPRRPGSLTVWLGVDDVAGGTIPRRNAPLLRNRKLGRQRKDSKQAIETAGAGAPRAGPHRPHSTELAAPSGCEGPC